MLTLYFSHTNGKEFSEKGIQIVVNHFKSRGHIVKVFLPQHVRRKKYSYLEQLYKEGIVVFTPSRKIAGRQITSYDDRYIKLQHFYYINRKIYILLHSLKYKSTNYFYIVKYFVL